MSRGRLMLVGGHSRTVGKTTAVERVLSARRGEPWVAVKVSAHRHAPVACGAPIIEEDTHPSPVTQTGRYLLAGAVRAFLCRCPDAQLPAAAEFITSLCAAGANVVVESNRIVDWLEPDVVLFAVAPDIDDWKPSSARIAPRADALVVCRQEPLAKMRSLSSRGRPTFALNDDRAVARFAGWLDGWWGHRPRNRLSLVLSCLLAAALLGNGLAYAQGPPSTAATGASQWRWGVQNLTRLEMWSFFEPPPAGGDPESVFIGNRTRAVLSRTSRWVDLSGAVQFVQFGGLPTNAVGPGFLGTGGLYYEHSGERNPGSFFLPALNARVKLAHGVTLLAGRFGYTSGAESPSGQPRIETVKRARIDSRLIGDFEWSLFQRAFDGIRGDLDRRRWHASAAWLRPTQGGFEDDAGTRIDQIDVVAATVSLRPGVLLRATDVAAFGYTYSDHRPVTGRPDNTGRAADRARVSVNAFGGSAVGAARRGRGDVDWLVWFAAQTGRWYEQRHRAWSMAIEGGYHWAASPGVPWLRGGYLHASGDGDASDDRHGTFFPMLPTVRRYASTTVYAPMNLEDAFVELSVRPMSRLRARGDVRRVSLANGADRWYAGSGATERRGGYFGYAGRPSGGHTDFGTVFAASLDATMTGHWTLSGFVGGIKGGRVVTTLFRTAALRYGYVETVLQF